MVFHTELECLLDLVETAWKGQNTLAYYENLIITHTKVVKHWAQAEFYKTFYFPNLQMFVISWSVCPRQPFPA
jgi:hypothetical protein